MASIPKYPGRQGVPNVRDLIAFRQSRQGGGQQAGASLSQSPDMHTNSPPPLAPNTQMMPQPPVFSAPKPMNQGVGSGIGTGTGMMPNFSVPQGMPQFRPPQMMPLQGQGAGSIASPNTAGTSNLPTMPMTMLPPQASTNYLNLGKNLDSLNGPGTMGYGATPAGTAQAAATSPAAPAVDNRSPLEKLYDEKLASLDTDEKRAREMLEAQNASNDRRSAAFAGQYGYGVGSGGAAALARQADIADKEALNKLMLGYGDRRRDVADQRISDARTAEQNIFNLRTTIAQNGESDNGFEEDVIKNGDKYKNATSVEEMQQIYEQTTGKKASGGGVTSGVTATGALSDEFKKPYYNEKSGKNSGGVKSIKRDKEGDWTVTLDDGSSLTVEMNGVGKRKSSGSAKAIQEFQDKYDSNAPMGEVVGFVAAYYKKTGNWPTAAQIKEHVDSL